MFPYRWGGSTKPGRFQRRGPTKSSTWSSRLAIGRGAKDPIKVCGYAQSWTMVVSSGCCCVCQSLHLTTVASSGCVSFREFVGSPVGSPSICSVCHTTFTALSKLQTRHQLRLLRRLFIQTANDKSHEHSPHLLIRTGNSPPTHKACKCFCAHFTS